VLRAVTTSGRLCAVVLSLMATSPGLAWDSTNDPDVNERHTHSRFMEFAIAKVVADHPRFWHVSQPSVAQALDEGANTEAHYPRIRTERTTGGARTPMVGGGMRCDFDRRISPRSIEGSACSVT